MSLLYSTLAGVYHEMYQHIFDYDEEFSFYDTILKANNCKKILEIGCGSGMLARRFLKQEYDYLGVDISENMLDIARLETNSDRFHQSDMREFIETGWTWNWDAHYIIEDAETITELHDVTTLRSFTKDEISFFTERAGFEIQRIIEEKKALTLIAEKR